MKTKTSVIKDILLGVKDYIVVMPGFLIRESMRYKDLRVGGNDPKKIYRAVVNLRHRGLVTLQDDRIYFTEKGKKWLKNFYQKHFELYTVAKDGKWRLTIFDIPEKLHKERNKFRRKLKLCGFYMLQHSVFVCPYACEDEIAETANELGVTEHVSIILADSLGSRDREVKKFFQSK